jgi:hypothetical protein
MGDPRNGLYPWFVHRDPDSKTGHQRPRRPQGVTRKIRREWDRAQEWLATHPSIANSVEARQRIGLWIANVDHLDWTGRAGIRDRAAYLAILERATEVGSISPAISVRTLCEATPYRGFKTMCRAIDSLAARGLIRVRVSVEAANPNTYILLEPPAGKSRDQVTHIDRASLGGNAVSLGPEVRTALGLALGAHTAAVYAVLASAPLSPEALAELAHVSRKTVVRKLKVLSEPGVDLAVKVEGGWVAGLADPALVAKEHGAADVEVDRMFRHAAQRDGWNRRPGQ